MVKEVINGLWVRPGGRYIDCTIGEGGHSLAILEASLPGGQLLGIDLDSRALASAKERLSPYKDSFLLRKAGFSQLEEVVLEHNYAPVHGILFDLGLSSLQLGSEGRGMSFQRDEPLDMRFDLEQELTAMEVVNGYSQEELASVISRYGEEPRARQIAEAIVNHRPVHTTGELAYIVQSAGSRSPRRINPATRTFQAIRMEVNRELENLSEGLHQAVNLLGYTARLVVISYHSLEDRLVKLFLRQESSDCICPPGLPRCVCGHKAVLKLISKKVITPSLGEVQANPRSRSARLRIAEHI
ncbi:MAG: 16S rRNA (cytosine(1402)-N(4))-methyltransferase RsmH [Chloroflexi bacterium]|nr:16S rRNA (cytosine(1402)-N(4))-methyltransferase RsmH [Chloroflexota bacterium]